MNSSNGDNLIDQIAMQEGDEGENISDSEFDAPLKTCTQKILVLLIIYNHLKLQTELFLFPIILSWQLKVLGEGVKEY